MTARTYLDGRVTLHAGDCLDVLRTMPDASVDSVVTDPPYEIAFMGKKWDNGSHAHTVELWAEVLRVLKPGGHLVAFGGTRTYHRLVCAVEDAGFEIRDQLAWLFGSGFPKSHNISKAIDKAAGAKREVVGRKTGRAATPRTDMRGGNYINGIAAAIDLSEITASATEVAKQWEGWGSALKPAFEPIVLARKPLIGTLVANVLAHGVGGLNVNGCRVASEGEDRKPVTGFANRNLLQRNAQANDRPWMKAADPEAGGAVQPHTLGRWPANVIHDGSDEVVEAFPESLGQRGIVDGQTSPREIYNGLTKPRSRAEPRGDSGSAARFFYSAKADADDRLGSTHPTVKPVDLMQWLVRLITPPGGTCLDPFAGTGTTGEAAFREGMRAVLIENDPDSIADIERRMGLVLGGPVERRHASIKARGRPEVKGTLL